MQVGARCGRRRPDACRGARLPAACRESRGRAPPLPRCAPRAELREPGRRGHSHRAGIRHLHRAGPDGRRRATLRAAAARARPRQRGAARCVRVTDRVLRERRRASRSPVQSHAGSTSPMTAVWHLDMAELRAAFNERTAAIVINTPQVRPGRAALRRRFVPDLDSPGPQCAIRGYPRPSANTQHELARSGHVTLVETPASPASCQNPTGKILTRAELMDIAAILNDFPRVAAISDEVRRRRLRGRPAAADAPCCRRSARRVPDTRNGRALLTTTHASPGVRAHHVRHGARALGDAARHVGAYADGVVFRCVLRSGARRRCHHLKALDATYVHACHQPRPRRCPPRCAATCRQDVQLHGLEDWMGGGAGEPREGCVPARLRRTVRARPRLAPPPPSPHTRGGLRLVNTPHCCSHLVQRHDCHEPVGAVLSVDAVADRGGVGVGAGARGRWREGRR